MGVYCFAFPLQTELIAEHAAVLKAKEKKGRESHLNVVNALERERDKHERTLAIASKQHDTDMDNLEFGFKYRVGCAMETQNKERV